jgi:hypothetical protein
MRVRAVVSTVVVGLSFLLGACGNSTPEPGSEPAAETTTTATVPSHAPQVITGPAGTLSVVVREPPARAASAIRYLRIEDSAGKPVLEGHDGDIDAPPDGGCVMTTNP